MDKAFFILAISVPLLLLLRVIFREGMRISSLSEFLYSKSETGSCGLSYSTTWKTAVASHFQSTSVLIVGLTIGFYYGFSMILTAITFSVGIYILFYFQHFLPSATLKRIFDSEALPYDRLFGHLGKLEFYVLNFLIYFILIFNAVLELWLVTKLISQISGTIFPVFDNIAATESEYYSTYFIVMLMSLLLFFYVYVGGYRAVAHTDEYQLRFIYILAGTTILGAIAVLFSYDSYDFSRFMWGTTNVQFSDIGFLFLLLGIVALNTFWQFVDPQQWQRARAAESAEIYHKSLLKTAKATFIIWAIPVVAGCILAGVGQRLVTSGVGIEFVPFQIWHQLLDSSYIGELFAAIILGISVFGLICASMSSSDTAVIAFLARIATIQPTTSTLEKTRRVSTVVTMLIFFLAIGLYILDKRVEQVIFALFSAQVLFAPYFMRWILSAGNLTMRSGRPTHITIAAFVISFIVAVAVNFIPFFNTLLSGVGYLWPVIVLMIGTILSYYALEQKDA